MRAWLKAKKYRNAMVSVDNDDYQYSFKINQAKRLKKKINYSKVKRLFLQHMLGAVEFYDELALKALGRSPKHVLLLHEQDVTVMFLEDLVGELRKRGWKIIPAVEAFQDPLYLSAPNNTYANNGILAQLAFEKGGEKQGYFKFEQINRELDALLELR